MPKFRKKPVVIEATQWFKPGDHPAVNDGAERLSWPPGTITMIAGQPCCYIQTLEGPHIVRPGDWIIRGVQGEFYSCKPDIFAETYEEVV